MLTSKKQLAESFLEPLVRPLAKVSPNTLTLLGSIPPLLFFVCVINGWYIVALIAFLGNTFDMLDGLVARRFKRVTAFGGFLDSTMDRIADFLIITAFAFGGIVRWEIVAPLLLCAYLTSYIRAQGGVRSKDGASFAAGVGIIERTERLLLIGFALLVYIFIPEMVLYEFNAAELVFLLTLTLSIYTVLQRILYAYKKL